MPSLRQFQVWKKSAVNNAACIFVEKEPQPFSKLEAFAKTHSSSRVQAIALRGRFCENIPVIEDYLHALGPNAFKFVFLDQKGWAATPIEKLRPFVGMRSCELLFTVMTSFLTRFVDRDGLATSYEALFGKEDVLSRIRKLPNGKGLREEFIVDEYCRSLRDLCGFRYASQAVILEPLKERIRYYLASAVTRKAAMCGHLKTGHRGRPGRVVFTRSLRVCPSLFPLSCNL